MASNRFLMVPEDSSAARMPLPGVTMALAILLSSARFMRVPPGGRFLKLEIDGSQAKPRKCARALLTAAISSVERWPICRPILFEGIVVVQLIITCDRDDKPFSADAA